MSQEKVIKGIDIALSVLLTAGAGGAILTYIYLTKNTNLASEIIGTASGALFGGFSGYGIYRAGKAAVVKFARKERDKLITKREVPEVEKSEVEKTTQNIKEEIDASAKQQGDVGAIEEAAQNAGRGFVTGAAQGAVNVAHGAVQGIVNVGKRTAQVVGLASEGKEEEGYQTPTACSSSGCKLPDENTPLILRRHT